MARPESPVGPGPPALEAFATDLRRLREKAGNPGYRELARRALFSATTLSEAAGGRRLPTLAVTLGYVAACNGDQAEWEQRWRQLSAPDPAPTPADDPEAPYQGLASYGRDRAAWFFGREDAVAEIVSALAERTFLAVLGASGSGKSSVLRAGVVPALLESGAVARAVVLTPGGDPFGALAAELARFSVVPAGALRADLLAGPERFSPAVRQLLPAGERRALLIVVDQFEELFTHDVDEPVRAAFVATLLAAGENARVLLGVRADFYGHCVAVPGLARPLAAGQVLLGPMSAAQVRAAVIRPAERAGAMVEGALVSEIVAQVADRPGALPMASHALLEAWRRRRGRAITLAGYEAAGGLKGAVAQTAERVWSELDQAQRQAARHLWMRLAEVHEDGAEPAAVTGRRLPRSELDPNDPLTVGVLERLAAARLVTVDEHSVRVAHEVLLVAWPRLAGWLDEDRDGILVHRRLTEATGVWLALNRDPGSLYRGTALARVEEWSRSGSAQLTGAERDFLAASRRARDRWQSARRRRGQIATATLAVVSVVVAVLASVAFTEAHRARRTQALAVHRQLIADARAQLDRDPQLALLLARRAYAARPNPAGETILRQATLGWRGLATRAVFADRVSTAAVSRDGRYVVAVVPAAKAGRIQIWDARTPDRKPVSLPAAGPQLYGVTVSADGRRVAASYWDGTVRVWDRRRTPVPDPVVLPGTKTVRPIQFSPDGTSLASADEGGTVRLWRLSGSPTARVLPGSTGAGIGYGVAFSPDGRRLAGAWEGAPARVWDLTDPSDPGRRLPGSADAVDTDPLYSPDGDHVALAVGGSIQVVPVAGGEPVALGRLRESGPAAFSPDGRRLVTWNQYGVLALWDTGGPTDPLLLRGHAGGVWAAAFAAPDRLVSVGADGTVRTWDVGGPLAPSIRKPHADLVHLTRFSPDGRFLATAGAFDGLVRVWSVSGRELRDPVDLAGPPGLTLDVVFTQDGRRMISVDTAGMVRVWDLATARVIRSFTAEGTTRLALDAAGRTLLTSGDAGVRQWSASAPGAPRTLETGPAVAAISRDGRRVVTAAADGRLRLRRPDGTVLVTVPGHDGPVNSVEFSPDGRRVASLGSDSAVRIWAVPSDSAVPPVTVLVAAGEGSAIRRFSFTPDGRRLVMLGDAELTGIQVLSAQANVDPVLVQIPAPGPVGFSLAPDGRTVASVHADSSVRLWSCEVCGPTAEVLAVAAHRAPRTLTPGERQAYILTQ